MIRHSHGLGAVSFAGGRQELLQLDFDPDLAHIGSAFFAGEKPAVEKNLRALEVSRFRKVENQLENESGRGVCNIWIFFEEFHPLHRCTSEQAESLVRAHINRGVRGVTFQTVPKGSQSLFWVELLMQQGKPKAGVEDGEIRVKLSR